MQLKSWAFLRFSFVKIFKQINNPDEAISFALPSLDSSINNGFQTTSFGA